MRLTPTVITLLALITHLPLMAQNLESIGKEKPISITGSLSVNQILYGVTGIPSRRDPYTYYASANVNFSLYGWSVPLSVSISNQNTTFQQPFNQYSLHPTYKWVTGHLGYISMSYSPYTVSGHMFLGAGVDLAPTDKWKLSAMYGRLLKAVEPDSTGTNAAFQRMGYGFKATYGDAQNFAELVLFHAKDDPSSIHANLDSLDIMPQENLVMSIGGGKRVFDNFMLKAELSTSAISKDVRAVESDNRNVLAKPKFLYTPRTSSSYYNAFKSSFAYQQEGYSIGVAYERIAPQYRTLGAYFFNNDMENITMNGAVAMFQGKVNVAVNAGTQRDNLDKSKISTMRRVVGSANIGYVPSQKLNFGLSYSNFQTFTNIRSQFVDINQLTPYDNLDTLNFTQISQNATLTAVYMFGKNENRRQTLNTNLTVQDAADKQGEATQNSGIRFYNTNVAYALNLVPQNMMISVSFNGTLNKGATADSKTVGPTAAVSKSFLNKKLRATLSSSYNSTYNNNELVTTIINGRMNGGMTIQKKHNINLSLVVVNRKSNTESSSQAFTEFTGTLGYSYSFGIN